MLDKTKQQLISISAIQFVFSFKPLISTYFDAHFLPAHHHFKGELRQAPPNLHSEEVYLIATQNQSISKQFPNFQLRLLSLKWYRKQAAPAFFLPYFTVPLDQEHTSCWLHLLPFNSALQGNRCISITHTYVTACHPGSTHRVQLIHSTVLPLAARHRGAGGKQESHLCFEGQR